jgi:hypothetical protein
MNTALTRFGYTYLFECGARDVEGSRQSGDRKATHADEDAEPGLHDDRVVRVLS